VIDQIRNQLVQTIDAPLVDQLLRAYTDLKSNYYLDKHKPSELEGGHFAEVVIRILQFITTGTYTPLGQTLARFDTRELERYSNLPSATYSDSIRIHIPRAVFAIYGIRSRRGVGHVGGDINANLSDASFIVATCDWILAELLRLYYTSSLEEAQKLVDTLVARKVPLIQDFDGFLKVLDPALSVPRRVLVLLYQRGTSGALREELGQWVETSSSNLSTALSRLEYDHKYIHGAGGRYFITRSGENFVEDNIPLHLRK
jgi:hypothetical protein